MTHKVQAMSSHFPTVVVWCCALFLHPHPPAEHRFQESGVTPPAQAAPSKPKDKGKQNKQPDQPPAKPPEKPPAGPGGDEIGGVRLSAVTVTSVSEDSLVVTDAHGKEWTFVVDKKTSVLGRRGASKKGPKPSGSDSHQIANYVKAGSKVDVVGEVRNEQTFAKSVRIVM